MSSASLAPDPVVTIAVRSPRTADRPRVAVILPTFRRPGHLLMTLASLREQTIGEPFAVIVVENDAAGCAGLEAAKPLFTEGEIAGLILVAHERGNCSAYNAGFAAALAEYPSAEFCLAIDDDEIASPDWARRLIETAEQFGTDLVGGPQIPQFETNGNRHGGHPVFRPPYARTSVVPILYSSGNVLIRRRVLETMGSPVLDPAFNFVGGGDSDFFSRCRDKGFRFGWCAQAPVFETTPNRRTELSWLNARSLRNGAISAIIEHRRRPGIRGRTRTLAKSLALLAAAPARGALLGLKTRSALNALYPAQIAIGRLQAEFGIIGEQYREPEKN